jgi:hypothetical protein
VKRKNKAKRNILKLNEEETASIYFRFEEKRNENTEAKRSKKKNTEAKRKICEAKRSGNITAIFFA